MKKYELMYILMPTLSDEELEKENEKLQKLLTDNGAQITGVNKWGRRDLAYEIKKQTKGYYVVVELNAEGAIVRQPKSGFLTKRSCVSFSPLLTN